MYEAACGHKEYGENGHCAVMECKGYINKCPEHGISGERGICSLDKIGE